MTDTTRRNEKLAVLEALLTHDLSHAKWTKSASSVGGSGDCLEATHIPEKGGWILRHSILTHHIIPLTESEYAAYVAGVQAGQPGLIPDA
ncbi:DUF397 domain-containing protein [Streptomyces sp. NPDC004610]|uniref:DUF397 domain-containing protein n=1 Tax=unclassified Streptomyces TaxID=2593676 RepID=UPI0033A84E83